MTQNIEIPDISVPISDRSTGFINETWYRWLEIFHFGFSDLSLAGISGSLASLNTLVAALQADIVVMKDAPTKEVFQFLVTGPTAVVDIPTGAGAYFFWVPPELDGYDLISVWAALTTPNTTGTLEIQVTNPADMLSTSVTVDATETGSNTSAVIQELDPANQAVTAGDILSVDVITSGVDGRGLIVTLVFQ